MTRFTWRDGDRTISFGRGSVDDAPDLLQAGYVLLTTTRARPDIPTAIRDGAAATFEVGAGTVDVLAGALLPDIEASAPTMVVAFGGGRVIDTAKAAAGVLRVPAGAIPTTLSSAEMTRVHRRPAGFEDRATSVRPSVVVNDAALCASQPTQGLAASSANALAHAVEGGASKLGNPVTALVAREAERLINAAWQHEDPGDSERDQLALASLLAGYVIDAAWYGLHHVLAQTLVRGAGIGHGAANAALLPHTIAALERRTPGAVDPDGTLVALATRLAAVAGASSLERLGVPRDALPGLVDAALGRPELDNILPRAEREELLALYEAAWPRAPSLDRA
jgi:alcohol dehydrogenase class IV